jgi:hypothetical protein
MLDKQNWEMALVELIVPTQVRNVEFEESFFRIVSADLGIDGAFAIKNGRKKESGMLCSIPVGTYATPTHLVEELNTVIKNSTNETLGPRNIQFGLEFSKVQKRVKFTGNSNEIQVGLRFHPKLLMKLGGEDVEPKNDDTTIIFKDKDGKKKAGIDVYPDKANDKFKYGVDLNLGMNHLFIYSDLSEYTLVGDVEVPLLRVVPFEPRTKAGTNPHLHIEFLNLHYVPVSKSFFDEISIHISGDAEKEVHFTHGKSMVKLHFRRKTK